MSGLVHIYTGDGKGKTTAAIGLGIRAYGNGMKVLMVQFLKGTKTGEINVLDNLKPNFVFHRGRQVKGFIWNMSEEQVEELRQITREDFNYACEAVKNGDFQMLILDEIIGCLTNGLISLKEVLDFIKNRPGDLEVIMTGRNAPVELMELADYISDIKQVKHPFERQVPARKGIEF